MNTHLSSLVRSPHVLEFVSHGPAQTIRVGQRLGELLQPGDLVLLVGDFGVGKTHLAKGIARGLGSDDLVNSPSFVLVNEYRTGPDRGARTIYHVDLYRIEDPAEVIAIGLDEALSGEGICLIEWPEHASAMLPHERLEVVMRHLSETKRVIRLVPHGARYEAITGALKQSAFA